MEPAPTPVIVRTEGRKKKDEISEEERILRDARAKQQLISKERRRIEYFQIRHEAAIRIQKAWKMYKFRAKGLMKNARESVRQKRLDAGELEWRRQIAACTIQLAWRKYYRRRLLELLNAPPPPSPCGVRDVTRRRGGGGGVRKRFMHMYDASAMATKQSTVLDQIYREHLFAPHWHPVPRAVDRPSYLREAGSSAALSFNFALDQYYPVSWLYEHDSGVDMYANGFVKDVEAPTSPATARLQPKPSRPLRSPELVADDIDTLVGSSAMHMDMTSLAMNQSRRAAFAGGQSRRDSSSY